MSFLESIADILNALNALLKDNPEAYRLLKFFWWILIARLFIQTLKRILNKIRPDLPYKHCKKWE